MAKITVKQLEEKLKQEIQLLYSPEETSAIIFRVLNYVLNFSRSDIYFKQSEIISEEDIPKIEKIIAEVRLHKPLQYIFGETEFYGLNFKVNPNVLIPRPETEELVDWILKEQPDSQLSIVDFGTGSGCIAISLAKHRPNWKTTAADISNDALEIARKNASINNVEIDFRIEDMLNFSDELKKTSFDIIVSNPPYVSHDQKKQMLPNVLNHEPHLALFAPGNDPLIFYRKIAEFASVTLRKKGSVYVELNEDAYEQTSDIFRHFGFETLLKKDIHEKYRMLKAFRND